MEDHSRSHDHCRKHHRRGRGRRFGGKGAKMFAMKRPLRFLVHKLELDDDQSMIVADAMNDFRIERAQFEVDRSRAKKTLMDALKKETFDDDQANDAIEAAASATKALQTAFTASLKRIHAVLDEGQRQKLAVLLAGMSFDV